MSENDKNIINQSKNSIFLNILTENFDIKSNKDIPLKYSPLYTKLSKKLYPKFYYIFNDRVRERIKFSLIIIYLTFLIITLMHFFPWSNNLLYISPVLGIAFISTNLGEHLQKIFFILFGTLYGVLFGFILSYVNSIIVLIIIYFFVLLFFNTITTWTRLSYIHFNLSSTVIIIIPIIKSQYSKVQILKESIRLLLIPCLLGIVVLIFPFPRLAIYESKRKITKISYNLILLSNIVIKSFLSKDFYTLQDINFKFYEDTISEGICKLKELQLFVENEVIIFFYAKDYAKSLLVYVEISELILKKLGNINEVVEKIIFNKTQNLVIENIKTELLDMLKEIELLITISTEFLHIFQPSPFRFIFWIKKLLKYSFRLCKGDEKIGYENIKGYFVRKGLSKESRDLIQERGKKKKRNSFSQYAKTLLRIEKREKLNTDIKSRSRNYSDEGKFEYDAKNELDDNYYSDEEKYAEDEDLYYDTIISDTLFNNIKDQDDNIKNSRSFMKEISEKIRKILFDNPLALRNEMEIEMQNSIDRLLLFRSKLLHKCNQFRKKNFYNKSNSKNDIKNPKSFDDYNKKKYYAVKSPFTPFSDDIYNKRIKNKDNSNFNIFDENLIDTYYSEYDKLINANILYESSNEVFKENLKYGINNIGPRAAFFHRFSILVEDIVKFKSIFSKKFEIFTYKDYTLNYILAPILNFYHLFKSIYDIIRLICLIFLNKIIKRNNEKVNKFSTELVQNHFHFIKPIIHSFKKDNSVFTSYILNLDVINFIHGLKISIIIIIPFSIVVTGILKGHLYNSGIWVILVVTLIRSDNISSSFLTSFQRIEGTIIGSLYSFIVYNNLPQKFRDSQIPWNIQLYTILPWVFICSYNRLSETHGYSATVASFTPLVLLLGFNFGIKSAWGRIEETFYAILLYLTIDNLFMPKRFITDLQLSLINCFKLNEKILFNLDKNFQIMLKFEKVSNDFNSLLVNYTCYSLEVVKNSTSAAKYNTENPQSELTIDVQSISETFSPITDSSKDFGTSKLSLSEGIINGKIVDGLNIYSNREENLNIANFSIDNNDSDTVNQKNLINMDKYIESNAKFFVENDLNKDIMFQKNVKVKESHYKQKLNNEVNQVFVKIDSDEKNIFDEINVEIDKIKKEGILLQEIQKESIKKEYDIDLLKEKIDFINIEKFQSAYTKRFNFIVTNTIKLYKLNSKITNNSNCLIRSYMNEITKQQLILKFIIFEPEFVLLLNEFPKNIYYNLLESFQTLLKDYQIFNDGLTDLSNIMLKMFKKMLKNFEDLQIKDDQDLETIYENFKSPENNSTYSESNNSQINSSNSNNLKNIFNSVSRINSFNSNLSNLRIENISAYMLNFFNLFYNFHKILKKMISSFKYFTSIFLDLNKNNTIINDFNKKILNLKLYLKNFIFILDEEFLYIFLNESTPKKNYSDNNNSNNNNNNNNNDSDIVDEDFNSINESIKSYSSSTNYENNYIFQLNPYFIYAWLNLYESIKIFILNLLKFCKTLQLFNNYKMLKND